MASGITIEPYNPEWPEIFRRLAYVIHNELGELALAIEHVGSTSVQGLSAKPIIDLDIIIEGEEQLAQVIKGLGQLGYFHQGDLGIEDRQAFGRINQFVPTDGNNTIWMEHHLYVCTKDSKELHRHLAFRNYLRKNQEAAAEYEKLKKELAKTAADRETYTEEKSGFINGILMKVGAADFSNNF